MKIPKKSHLTQIFCNALIWFYDWINDKLFVYLFVYIKVMILCLTVHIWHNYSCTFMDYFFSFKIQKRQLAAQSGNFNLSDKVFCDLFPDVAEVCRNTNFDVHPHTLCSSLYTTKPHLPVVSINCLNIYNCKSILRY